MKSKPKSNNYLIIEKDEIYIRNYINHAKTIIKNYFIH